MILFTILAVLGTTFYRVRISSRLLDPRLDRLVDNVFCGRIGRCCRLSPSLPGSVKRSRIGNAVRDSGCPAEYTEMLSRRM